MNISLRAFSTPDLPMLASWVANGDLSQFMSRWAPHSSVDGRFNGELTRWWVIVADGRDAGCVWLERSGPDETVADLGIFLAEAADRGHGIGRRALQLAQEAAAAPWHLQTVRLRVREANARALACYHAAGFETINRGEKIVAGERIRILEMARHLNRQTKQCLPGDQR